MAKRKTLSKKIRFEVFKRDSFTCQYCGRSAPDVILEVSGLNPVANGGDNDIMNLITSCRVQPRKGRNRNCLIQKQSRRKRNSLTNLMREEIIKNDVSNGSKGCITELKIR